jgi:hypothetical protein
MWFPYTQHLRFYSCADLCVGLNAISWWQKREPLQATLVPWYVETKFAKLCEWYDLHRLLVLHAATANVCVNVALS